MTVWRWTANSNVFWRWKSWTPRAWHGSSHQLHISHSTHSRRKEITFTLISQLFIPVEPIAIYFTYFNFQRIFFSYDKESTIIQDVSKFQKRSQLISITCNIWQMHFCIIIIFKREGLSRTLYEFVLCWNLCVLVHILSFHSYFFEIMNEKKKKNHLQAKVKDLNMNSKTNWSVFVWYHGDTIREAAETKLKSKLRLWKSNHWDEIGGTAVKHVKKTPYSFLKVRRISQPSGGYCSLSLDYDLVPLVHAFVYSLSSPLLCQDRRVITVFLFAGMNYLCE